MNCNKIVNNFFIDKKAANVKTPHQFAEPEEYLSIHITVMNMKQTPTRIFSQFTCLLLLSGALAAQAVNVTKLDTTTMNGGPADWSAAPATTDVGEFDATPQPATLAAMKLGGSLTLGGLLMDNNMTGPLSISSTGGYTLTLGANGIDMSAANQSVAFTNLVALGGNQTWLVASGQTNTFLGVITGTNVNAGVAGSGYPLTINDGTAGNSGTVIFGAQANTYPGGTLIKGGTVQIGNATSLGTGAITNLGGTLRIATNAALTVTVPMVFSNTTVIDYNFYPSGNQTLNGPWLGSGTIIISNMPSFANTLTISGNNASSTMTNFSGKIIVAPTTSSGGGSEGSLRLNGGSTSYNFGSTNMSVDLGVVPSAVALTARNNGTMSIGELKGGADTALIGSRASNGILNWSIGALGTSTTFAGTITNSYGGNSSSTSINAGGVCAITKAGAGTLTLTGTNYYTGNTTFSNGVLCAGSGEATAATANPVWAGGNANGFYGGPFGEPTNVTTQTHFIFSGGTLQYSANNQVDYSPRFSTAAGQAISIDVNGQNVTFGTALTSSGGSLTLSNAAPGSGSLTLTAAATYSGATTINNGGTLALSGSGALASGSAIIIAGGGTFDVSALGGTYTLGGSASLTASGNATAATIKGATTVSLGSQPITLNYDGSHPALTISQGTLSLNGNAFTVNGSVLPVGQYNIVSQSSGSITTAGSYPTPVGTAIPGAGYTKTISVSGGNVVLTILNATTTTLAAVTTPQTYGTVALSATVTPTPASGTVTFYDGATALSGAINVISGAAAYTPTAGQLVVGPHSITAVFSGDTLDAGSTSTASPLVITPKALTVVTAPSVPPSKVYDGTTATATPTGTPTLNAPEAAGPGTGGDGVPYTGDTVLPLSSATGSYDSPNVVGATTVTFNGMTAANGNYTITSPTQAAGITPKPLTVTGLSVTTPKVYDGTTATATPTGPPALLSQETPAFGSDTDGAPYTGDTVNIIGTPTGSYNLATVAGATTVTFNDLSSDNPNYSITAPTQAATITPKPLTVTAPSVPSSKVYDGMIDTAAPTGSATVSGAEEAKAFGTGGDGNPYIGDTVNVIGTATGSYNSADVAAAATVTFNNLSADNDNYSITAPTQAATITAKPLTVINLTAPSSKVYDGTTTAVVSGTPALNPAEAKAFGTGGDGNPYTGDTVNISGTATGSYNSANVAAATTVTFNNLSADNGNYSITAPTQAATITKASTTVTIASSKNPSLQRDNVTFTVNVQTNGVTTGLGDDANVQFVINSVNGAQAGLTAGVGSTNTATLPMSNNNTIGASYLGDGNLLASSITSLSQVVNQAPPFDVTKQNTTTMNGGGTDWSSAPNTWDIGEFSGAPASGTTPTAATLANMTLGGSLTLGGLKMDNNMAGPLSISSTGGYTLTLGTNGIDMSAANQNVAFTNLLALGGNQTWLVASGLTNTVNGVVSGSSFLTINDGTAGNSGMVVFGTQANTYSGGTVINGGIVQVWANASLGTGAITNNGGTLRLSSTNALSITVPLVFSGTSVIDNNLYGNGNVSLTGSWSGNGTIIVSNMLCYSNTITIGGASSTATMTNFSGKIIVAPTTSSGGGSEGSLRLNGGSTSYNFGSTNMSVDLGVVPSAVALTARNNGTMSIGELKGGADTALIGSRASNGILNWSIGALGTSTTFAGTITNSYGGNSSSTSINAGGVCAITKAGAGTLTLTGTNYYTGNTTFSNGVLCAGSGEATAATFNTIWQGGNANGFYGGPFGEPTNVTTQTHFIFIGGTLQYSANNQVDYSPRFSTAAGQAISIDVNGQNVTFGTALTSSGGSLTLSNATGSGTLTLTQPSTYSGGTTVAGGTLLVNNASGSGTGAGGVTVNNGAALGGTGTIGGAVAFNPGGGILAPGVAGAGTLSFSSTLALDALSVSKFVVNNTGGVLTRAAVTGTLTPHGSVIHISNSGAPLLPGTYTLFTYSGTVSGAFSATPVFDVGTAVHVSATTIVDDGAGHIKLVVPAPVARSFAMAATIGTPVTVPVIPKYATDPYGDPLTITAVSTPANGTATISGDLQSVIYTATAGTSDSFTYTVSDTYGATATGTVTVTVNQAGQGYNMLKAPVVNGDGTVTIGFLGIPGSQYALDWTAALSPTPVSWTPVVTNTAAGNGALNFTVTPVGDSGYYRTRYVAPVAP